MRFDVRAYQDMRQMHVRCYAKFEVSAGSLLQAANMHPAPPGETDEQRLHERLGHLHLDMHVMGGDGNCQVSSLTFTSISSSLQWQILEFLWSQCSMQTAGTSPCAFCAVAVAGVLHMASELQAIACAISQFRAISNNLYGSEQVSGAPMLPPAPCCTIQNPASEAVSLTDGPPFLCAVCSIIESFVTRS